MSKSTLRPEIQDFFSALELGELQEREGREEKNKLHVSEFVGFAAFAYEKLRNLVDYKDDVLLRKNAIKRLLRQRKVFGQVVKERTVAEDLLRELVLSRYLPNDSVPLKRIDEVATVIIKFRELQSELRQQGAFNPYIKKWLLGLEAMEIEHVLVIDPLPRAMTLYAYHLLQPVFRQTLRQVSDQDYNTQLVITLQRLLAKADGDILGYHLFKHQYPEWFSGQPINFSDVAKSLATAQHNQEKHLSNPLGRRMHILIGRTLIPFVVLRVMLREHGLAKVRGFINQVGEMIKFSEIAYKTHYNHVRARIRRKGFHAMVYIFLTKMALAILLELPYERLVLGQLNYLALGINLVLPPLLMLLITLSIMPTAKRNVDKLREGMKEVLYGSAEPVWLKPPLAKKVMPRWWSRLFFGLLTAVTFVASFGLIIYGLGELQFNFLSGALFIFFVSLVSFFGMSLRQQANSLKVIPPAGNIFTFIMDVIGLPMMWLGRWLSNTFDKINVFVLFMDFFIELPLKVLLRFLDRWFSFLRDKKEEML